MLDDKRKAPCCLMAAWGFAMGRMPDQVGHDGRVGHDGGGLAGEVFCDAFHVRINDSLFTSSALEVLKIRMRIHKEVFSEDCGAKGFAEDVEVFFPVGVVVGIVGSDALAWEVFYCSLVETVRKFIGLGLAFGCVAAPAGGVHPF